jgi:hypothetical protein
MPAANCRIWQASCNEAVHHRMGLRNEAVHHMGLRVLFVTPKTVFKSKVIFFFPSPSQSF